jgi:hypothetical protein
LIVVGVWRKNLGKGPPPPPPGKVHNCMSVEGGQRIGMINVLSLLRKTVQYKLAL